MHVLCFGAGAIGSLVGARLSESGIAVTLLARRDHVAAIRTHGLILETRRQRIVCKRVDSITMLDDLTGPPDIILLTVKAYHTRDALGALRPLAQGRTVIASLQNGVGNEDLIAAVCGAERTVAGTVTINVSRPRPGVVRQHSRAGGIGVATVDPRQDSSELIALFRRAGIPAAAYRDFRAMKWSKLLINLFTNATSAILDLSPVAVIDDPRLFELERGALREALRVMEALRLRPVALPGYPVPLLPTAMAAPPWLVRPLLRRYIRRGRGTSRPSLWQDLERGRAQSEVEVLNGAVAREGSRLGVPTPVNAVLAAVVQGLAIGRLDRGDFRQHPDALLATIADARSGSISTRATS
jgi:2-dehydropantoate 2-reductase